MPKALSLKKGQAAGPPKNQKAITQFFKNTTPCSQKPVSSAIETKEPVAQATLQSSKRKASSPPVFENRITESNPSTSGKIVIHKENNHKKTKTEKSPNKINGASISPKKNTIANKDDKVRELSPTLVKRDGLPLSPVKIDYNFKVKAVSNGDVTKSCISNGNHVENIIKVRTPVKSADHNHGRKSRTPKKSPIQEFQCTPVTKLRTPEKSIKDIVSPSKCGSTVKALVFDDHVEEAFGDDWDLDDVDEGSVEDLDLSKLQRCEVLSIEQNPNSLQLRLKNADKHVGTCLLEGVWLNTPLSQGDIVSAIAARNQSGQFIIDNANGLLVLHPDHLMSSTSVVAGVFCRRKAVLQERWRGIDPPNSAMTIGILVHELVQKALTQNIMEADRLRMEANGILKGSVQMLYDAGLTEKEARENIQTYITSLSEFMKTYVAGKPTSAAMHHGPKDKNLWHGHIDKVLDIEENICCPQLGLKGKIDATLQVTIYNRKGSKTTSEQEVVPLELKSGKASVSAEHRGQLVMYGMMLRAQKNDHPAVSSQRGLLLYLRDRIDLREVNCGYPERRDLVMLRNELVQYLASTQHTDPDQLNDIEEASVSLQQKLPEPIHHENVCSKCPYATLCSIHLWHTDGPRVTEKHPLSKLREQMLGHLSPEHIKYFQHWTALLKLEEQVQMTSAPLHALWTDSVDKRSKRGTCAANLNLKSVTASGDRHVHVFVKQNIEHNVQIESKAKGPQEGEFSIVSIEGRPWIAAGVVLVASDREIHILLERDLSRRLSKDMLYHIDTYESYATTVQNLTNLGVLMEDRDCASRLRSIIIDKSPAQFSKLPRAVGRLGVKLMRALNVDQQRAVLGALSAEHYALLRGLPGTGKTQTVSVLIQMLVGLNLRVLVTAHTHSAVDTLLARLPDSLRVMRLGSSSRIAASLVNRSEQSLTSDCKTPEQLAALYDSMDVVGVTCLGAAHAMLARTTFDVCIVDEATQVLQCTVLRPLFAAKRFVLVGDPEQLPPVIRSKAARRLGMEESLFHRLMNEDTTYTLQLQYRMNQALTDVANKIAYSDRLKCADQSVAEAKININLKKINDCISSILWLKMACSPEREHAALFLDTQSVESIDGSTGRNQPCVNTTEACLVLALVETLRDGDMQPTDIGVIAPYRDQVSLLRKALVRHGVEVSTVDQFQGRDKSVIIYSCTRHCEDRSVKEGEVLNDQRRLAVSVTRAKYKLLVVGNSAALRRYTPLQRLIEATVTVQLDKHDIINARDKYITLLS